MTDVRQWRMSLNNDNEIDKLGEQNEEINERIYSVSLNERKRETRRPLAALMETSMNSKSFLTEGLCSPAGLVIAITGVSTRNSLMCPASLGWNWFLDVSIDGRVLRPGHGATVDEIVPKHRRR